MRFLDGQKNVRKLGLNKVSNHKCSIEVVYSLYLNTENGGAPSILLTAHSSFSRNYHWHTIAGHLLKWIHFQQDYEGKNIALHYFRNTDKREVDFVIMQNKVPIQAIECKLKSREISSHLKYFKSKFPDVECLQVHLENTKEYESKEGIKSLSWHTFLRNLL